MFSWIVEQNVLLGVDGCPDQTPHAYCFADADAPLIKNVDAELYNHLTAAYG